MSTAKKKLPKVKDQVVVIPEWSLTVSVIKLTKEQAEEYLNFIEKGCYFNRSQFDCDLALVTYCAVDTGGTRIFRDVDILFKRKAEIVQLLIDAAIDKNSNIRYIKKQAKDKPVSKPKKEREENDGKSNRTETDTRENESIEGEAEQGATE